MVKNYLENVKKTKRFFHKFYYNKTKFSNFSNSRLKNLCAKRVYSYWKRFNILYSTFAYREKRLFDENMRIARQFVIDVIENRLQYLLKQNSDPNNHDLKGDNGKGMCFVDILLQSTIDGQPLSNEYILDETHTFMIGVSI